MMRANRFLSSPVPEFPRNARFGVEQEEWVCEDACFDSMDTDEMEYWDDLAAMDEEDEFDFDNLDTPYPDEYYPDGF